MAYIVFVNPSILKDAGMPVPAVFAATCMAAAFGTILMGAFARYPIALAPGMGLNAYFTYTVVKGMGVPWQTALGAVFLSGVAFLILTVVGVRQWIIAAIPAELYAAVSAGIGLFIAFVGLRNAGIVKADPATIVSMGNLRDPNVALAVFGILLIAALQAWKVRAAILLGILSTTAVGAMEGWCIGSRNPIDGATFPGPCCNWMCGERSGWGFSRSSSCFCSWIYSTTSAHWWGSARRPGLLEANNRIPRVNRILLTDATATIGGSLLGTTTVVSYIESAAGVAAGGRTGVTSIVTGVLFIAALFVAPLIGAVPSAATAPALVVVGGLMISAVAEIQWDDVCTAFPAFLTLITIPLTFSIANGLACGIISYVVIHVACGRWRQVSWAAYVIAALLAIRFVYIGGKTYRCELREGLGQN